MILDLKRDAISTTNSTPINSFQSSLSTVLPRCVNANTKYTTLESLDGIGMASHTDIPLNPENAEIRLLHFNLRREDSLDDQAPTKSVLACTVQTLSLYDRIDEYSEYEQRAGISLSSSSKLDGWKKTCAVSFLAADDGNARNSG